MLDHSNPHSLTCVSQSPFINGLYSFFAYLSPMWDNPIPRWVCLMRSTGSCGLLSSSRRGWASLLLKFYRIQLRKLWPLVWGLEGTTCLYSEIRKGEDFSVQTTPSPNSVGISRNSTGWHKQFSSANPAQFNGIIKVI